MKYEITNFKVGNGPVISIVCPHCGHNGTFHSLTQDLITDKYYFGQRKCPNIKCLGHIFFISDRNGNIKRTFPGNTIPIVKEGIPNKILNTIEEANTCYSENCFIAAGIMIRKTLEVMCEDQNVQGDNLKQRINNLGTKIMVPKELTEGMDELRLLGNDAAHVEAKTFEQICKDKIEISMEFTKEILKAVYQYEDLLDKIRSLKKKEI